MVNGITFSEQLITSSNFAHFMYTFLNHANGITKGCGISQADGNIYIQKGYFIEFGRFVQVIGVEEIPSPEVVSGQLYCKLVFEIDLGKENTVTEFNQGYFKTLTSTTGYPDLTQDDLDADGTVYQMPWCQYIKKVDGISDFRDIRQILNLDSIWAAVAEQNTTYKGEFESYFASQKVVIEQMITDLQGEGYLLMADARAVKPVSLLASGWTGSAAPYSQTVNVTGILATDTPILVKSLIGTEAEAAVKAYNKAFGFIFAGETGNGTVTIKAYKKPATDITIGLKGV